MKALGRRELLMGLSGALGATALGSALSRAEDQATPASTDADRKLLFVLCASGGASIIDSFMPVSRSEVDDDALAETLNIYEDEQIIVPAGSNLRCPGYVEANGLLAGLYSAGFPIDTFLTKHHANMTVLAQECSSVNHEVAQSRSLNGAGINRGRTLMEEMALRHGDGLVLPNCNMSTDGYIQPGVDDSIPAFARAEVIAAPLGFAAAMHGSRAILDAPPENLIAHARALREQLDDDSTFGRTFVDSERRQRFLANRREVMPLLEEADLMSALTLIPPEQLDPIYGVTSSPLLPELAARFPRVISDPWHAQAALSVLLAYYGLSCATTIGLRFEPVFAGEELVSTPLAFDFSHSDHRVAQYVMWGQVLEVLDGLIGLLQQLDYLGDPSLGKMWDRSLIYVATDFGRDKTRPDGADSWTTGHSLNNGTLLLSPLLKGNRVFGGVDPKTCRTYGFDGATGTADPSLRCDESHIYSAIAHALDIEFPGRHDMSALLA